MGSTSALLPLDLCEEAIQIAQVRHVSLDACPISSDFRYRRRQLRVTAPRDEDVRAFVHKLLRRRQADAAIAARNEGNLSFQLTHVLLLMSGFAQRLRHRTAERLAEPHP